ncbi:hypothetical protein [Streptomyces sp. MI02-7b]|uniref:hypothetical protein n=1 Tax=Streptomyces sp. MI02-7b TaxID=462941 RepID=UPI0029AF0735|nr:hypothetical protein [Streptomyces sp. MI02-7b]MDX3076492.1 hypothetical protein [Streptomyces sp. MI02-7b]
MSDQQTAPPAAAPALAGVGGTAESVAAEEPGAAVTGVEAIPGPVDAPGAPAHPVAVQDPVLSADPGAPAPVPPPRDRRRLRAALRWTSAVLVFAVLGGATAYAVTLPRRTDVPGLETPDDGRWTYPALRLPKLPAGAPRAYAGDRNPGGVHYADLRALLLPAARGAKVDRSFDGKDGWLPTARFIDAFEEADRKGLAERLPQAGLRHIAARAWDMPDGTRTEIYLLQFISAPYAEEGRFDMTTIAELSGAPIKVLDQDWKRGMTFPGDMSVSTYSEDKPRGREHVRSAFIVSGDTIAVIAMSKAGTQPAVPFHQTVLLQSQLLG